MTGIDLGLRRMRIVAVAVLGIGAATLQLGLVWSDRPSQVVAVAVLVATLLCINLVAVRRERSAASPGRLVRLEVAADVVVTIALIVLLDAPPNSPAILLAVLPVLHAALRYGLLGAAAAWLAVAVGLCAQVIAGWEPGAGIGSFSDLAIGLAVVAATTLPAAHVCQALLRALDVVIGRSADLDERSRLLAVLEVAFQDLLTTDLAKICSTATEAAVHLGFAYAEVVSIDHRGQIVQRGGHAGTRPEAAPFRPEDVDRLALTLEPGRVGTDPDGNGRWVGVIGVPRERFVLRVCGEGIEPASPRVEALEALVRSTYLALQVAREHKRLAVGSREQRERSRRDPLTGLLTRQAFLAHLGSPTGNLDATTEATSAATASVVVVSLNGFAQVNENYGEAVGDAVLVAAARRLDSVQPEGVVARLSGDEFALLVADGLDEDAEAVREDVTAQLSHPYAHQGRTVRVSAAVGVAAVAGAELDDVLQRARRAMYEQKVLGSPDIARGQELSPLERPATDEWRHSLSAALGDLAEDHERTR